ncbi:glycosyltransferase family 39 protein [Patescibacteria group bacterium]|nr:glycosyltransferase family 39 protein [Patescibacteria group bacterium]MBU1970696.1 glycosyltransferase family 39 protein [Patescibacteria group bacterium]
MGKKSELLFILVLLIVSGWLRFAQLGYSHFYGDETKTLYLRKDVSATNFLMNQRKGPIQFLVVWTMEKLSGGFGEAMVRLPFAVAGTVLVVLFYVFVRSQFGVKTAVFASLFFSFSGFNIAFSRTAQYQVFYLLFGFLALILAQKSKLLWSAMAMGLALLSHYDGLFFCIPLYFSVNRKTFLRIMLLALLIAGFFYLPAIWLGYFKTNVIGYLSKRAAGEGYSKNNSLYTLLVYHPLYIFLTSVGLWSVIGLLKPPRSQIGKSLIFWFLVPFVVFQFFTLNPGTHIHNYLIPLYIAAGLALAGISKRLSGLVYPLLALIYLIILAIQAWVFVPQVNTGYPWQKAYLLGLPLDRVSNNYHLYLYGFPYDREWDKIGAYFASLKGVRNFYTNDNETVAEYYLNVVPYSAPGTDFWPQYYIEIADPQELKKKDDIPKSRYELVLTDEISKAKIYKKLPYD